MNFHLLKPTAAFPVCHILIFEWVKTFHSLLSTSLSEFQSHFFEYNVKDPSTAQRWRNVLYRLFPLFLELYFFILFFYFFIFLRLFLETNVSILYKLPLFFLSHFFIFSESSFFVHVQQQQRLEYVSYLALSF